MNEAVLDAYCWMYSSFLMMKDSTMPCTTKSDKYEFFDADSGPLYNTYYQWVSLYLIICAIIFLLPR